MNTGHRRLITVLGLISFSGNLALPLTDAISILLHPGYNPLMKSVSDLALGPLGWIQGVGIGLGGIASIACAAGLFLKLGRQWEVRLGEVLLCLVGIALVLAAVFHANLPGAPPDLSGRIHGNASIFSGIAILPVFFLVAFGLRNNRHLFIYTIVAGCLQIVLEVGRGRLPSNWTFFGLHERLVGANPVLWEIFISWIILVKHRLKTG